MQHHQSSPASNVPEISQINETALESPSTRWLARGANEPWKALFQLQLREIVSFLLHGGKVSGYVISPPLNGVRRAR